MKMDMLRFVGASTVDFPLEGTESSGPFVLKGAEGLGPPEVTVKMVRTVLEKGLYQGKTAALRQVIAVVGLQPNWDDGQTPEQLRTQLYSLLTPKFGAMVRMEVRHGGLLQGYADGQISALVPVLFTRDPAVQIVLDCDYPYLLDSQVTQTPTQRTVAGLQVFDIENEGTAPAGFKTGITLGAAVAAPLILSDEGVPGQKIQIDGINWVSGDTFVVDTRAGSRGVWRIPNGETVPTTILANLNGAVSEWIQLHGGPNTLKLNTTALSFHANYDFVHRPAYWGV